MTANLNLNPGAANPSYSSSSIWNQFLIRIFLKLGTVGTGLIAIIAGLLYAKQESLLYFPEIAGLPRRPSSNPKSYRSPAEYDIPFTSHMIQTKDGVSIHAWLLLQKDRAGTQAGTQAGTRSTVPTIIFFHGNAGNIGLRLPNAAQMYQHLTCNILMVEYRGYGDSHDCKPTEHGLKLDAEAAYHFLLDLNNANKQGGPDPNSYLSHGDYDDIYNHNNDIFIDTSKIFVFGRSLGGAVAFHLAKYTEQLHYQHQQSPPPPLLRGIIVENTFTSIPKMVDQLMPLIAPLKSLILRMQWNNEQIAPTLQTPILYLAGQNDELVPHSQMQDLYMKSTREKGGRSVYAKMHVIRKGTHNDSWIQGGMEYYHAIQSFMSYVILHGDVLLRGSSCTSSVGPLRSLGLGLGSTTSRSSILSSTSTSSSSMEVSMGGGEQRRQQGSNIPIMPTNIIGMAKEASKSFAAATSSSSTTASDKKNKEI